MGSEEEIIIIVNKDDELIKYLSRKDILTLQEGEHVRISACWITNTSGDILLAQRAFDKKTNPGKRGPAVTGTVNQGETYVSNILGELEEELGILVTEDQLLVLEKRTYKRTYGGRCCQYFGLTLDQDIDDFVIQKDEVENIGWFTQEYLIQDIEQFPEKYTEGGSVKRCLENL